MARRIPVVTGLGVVSSAGIGAKRFWDGLQLEDHHFRELTLFEPIGLPNRIASEIGPWVPGFDALDKDLLARSRISAFAALALGEALEQATIEAVALDRVLVGTTVGDIATQEVAIRTAFAAGGDGPVRLRVDREFRRILSALHADAHVELLLTACSAGNLAVIRAAQLIESGQADVVVAGGAEAFSRMAFVGFARMRGMAARRCRPFSESRDGMLLGEGAAFAVLESTEHATARGAVPLAQLAGYGMTCDAKHPSAPDSSGDGIARAVRAALAGRHPREVDFVCAHGTGTPQNDAAEAKAYAAVFAESRPPVSSLKGSIGHALGAASAIELVACVLGLQHQQLVPQRGLEGDATLDLRLVSQVEPERDIRLVLNTAMAFGGNNTCIALTKPAQAATGKLDTGDRIPSVHVARATVASDFSVAAGNGRERPELDAAALSRLDRRFRSRRAGVVAVAIERWREVAKPSDTPAPDRCAIVLGTETGAAADIERFLAEAITRGDAVVNPGLFPWTVHNAAAGVAAIAALCRGPNIVLSSGTETGRSTILTAVAQLEAGCADLVYCGVYESTDAGGTIAAITALAVRPELLGASYLGALAEVHIEVDETAGTPGGVLRWAEIFRTQGFEAKTATR